MLEPGASNENIATAADKDFENVHTYGKFVGRQSELETLDKLLNDKTIQYITIRGFGGIGKTTLAIQAVKNFNSGRVLVQSLVGSPSSGSVILKIARFLNMDTTAFPTSDILQTEVERQRNHTVLS